MRADYAGGCLEESLPGGDLAGLPGWAAPVPSGRLEALRPAGGDPGMATGSGGAPPWAGGGRGEGWILNGEGPVIFFVSGKTRNLLNASGLHWRMRQKYHKEWRTKVKAMALVSGAASKRGSPESRVPKHIHIHAMVWSLYDPDGLRSALKPAVDGLVDAGILSDDSEKSGHQIDYSQEVSRARPGLEIRVGLR